MNPTITPQELSSRLTSGEHVVLLDVREPFEHEEFHLPNTKLIPLGVLPLKLDELTDFKDGEIVVYCRSGGRSAQACALLRAHGFSATNLTGGMLAWQAMNLA